MTLTDNDVVSTQHETEKLLRSVDFRATRDSDDGLTLEGYASVFNEWTTIQDRAGSFQERIAPGAFARSLGDKMPVLQFDHGHHPLIGSIPLGRFTTAREDERGLFVRARLSDNWLIQPVRDAIIDGGITGMSFRFSVTAESWENRDDGEYRTIEGVDLMEAGPVVWPAYGGTEVGVRARQTAFSLTDPEVRREVASLLTLGADELRNLVDESLATTPALPVEGASGPSDTLPEGRVSTRTKSQRQAIARLALSLKE